MRANLFLLVLAPLASAGCAGKRLPPETDCARGREVLTTVLEAWKQGGASERLKSGTPAIQVRDPDWAAGHKLAAYEIAHEDSRVGVDLLLTVKLTLTRADGRRQEKKVGYIVGIGSNTVVLRNE
jgi:hypothetical protein